MKQGNQGKRLTALAKKAKPKLPLTSLLLVIAVFAIGSMLVLFHSAHQVTVYTTNSNLDKPAPASSKIVGSKMQTPLERSIGDLKIPTPVFVTSLPKSGTTSTWKYFLCGLGSGQAAHQWAQVYNKDEKSNNNKEQVRLGKCFQQNMKQQRPMLEGCGDYHVWTDMGLIAPGTCFYPSIHGGLEALYKDYPKATLLSVVRETESWVNSTTEFNSLWDRWSGQCDEFPGKGSTREDYAKFYDWHTEMVRQFAKDHSSMTYIEVTLEGTDTGRILEEQTGINASCWVHSKTKKGKRAKPKWQQRREQEENQKLSETSEKKK